MRINILNKGDKVIGISNEFISVERKNGEIDLIPIFKDNGTIRIDVDSIVTIGYGKNTVEYISEDMIISNF